MQLIVSCLPALRRFYGVDGCHRIREAICELQSAMREGSALESAFADLPEMSPESRQHEGILALAAREHRADTILIVGSHAIVPFCVLYDQYARQHVYSDCLDLVRKGGHGWHEDAGVGRIVGDAHGTPGFIVGQLQRAANAHYAGGIELRNIMALTAEYCQSASRKVCRSWHTASTKTYACPPWGLSLGRYITTPFQPALLPRASLIYVALHGIKDVDFWFGESSDGAPPAAMAAEFAMLDARTADRASIEGSVICGSVCEGAYTFDRTETDSVCLALLKRGCQAFIGATAQTYEPDPPQRDLVLIDKLHALLVEEIASGTRLGRALVNARKRYSPKDAYDRVNALSLVLFGDPGLYRRNP